MLVMQHRSADNPSQEKRGKTKVTALRTLLLAAAALTAAQAGALAYDWSAAPTAPTFGGAPFDHQYEDNRGPAFGGSLFDSDPRGSSGYDSGYRAPSYGGGHHSNDDDD